MKPYIHAKNSAKKHGGIPEDYQEIHDMIDSPKSTLADIRHRAILHSTFGIFLVERALGTTITNSDGKKISVRTIAEEHVMEDLGFIPTVERWLKNMQIEEWMNGSRRGKNKRRVVMVLNKKEVCDD